MQEANQIKNKAKSEAESMKKEKILQAKERFIELKSEYEKVILDREKKIISVENRLHEKENAVNNEMRRAKEQNRKFEQKNNILDQKIETLKRKAEALEAEHQIQTERLETLSNLSAKEAKETLIDSLKEKAKTEAMGFVQNCVEEAKLTVQQEAQKIIINTIQRIGTEEAIENCVSVFNLESDDVKGRIIGREGRNIRALES